MDLSSEANQQAETSKPAAAPTWWGLSNAAFFSLTTCKQQEWGEAMKVPLPLPSGG